MFRITKQFHFSASHILVGLPVGHPCGRMHGHNYIVEVELASEKLNLNFMVRDYGELYKFKDLIDRELDHRHLNEYLNAECKDTADPNYVSPTAEALAFALYGLLKDDFPEAVAVRVSETPKTWAEYRP